MVLGILFLLVTLLAVISLIRQFKIKNALAFIVSGLSVLVFGFFSVATIISNIGGM